MAREYALNDTYHEVTDRIIAALEKGVAPWVCPWKRDSCGDGGRPRNGASGHVYKGINVILTGMAGYASNRWYTYRQCQTLGGYVRKGERGTTVIYWTFVDAKKSSSTALDNGDQGTATKAARKIPVLRSYTVFAAEQIEWPAGSKHAPFQATTATLDADDNYAEVEAVIAATGAKIDHGGTRAFYSPILDSITVPEKARFDDQAAYYATVLHELGHWTGHESRLGRDLKNRFGSNGYSAEELVAELASAFLAAELGIQGHLQHESYIANWLTILKNDKRAIFTASRHAQEAADYVLRLAGRVEAPNDLQEAA